MPYLSNPDFVKRPELFEGLKAALGYGSNPTDSTSQSRVSLFGLGGVGKTHIATEFVYWLRQTDPGVSVFWIHASTTERFQQAYTSFAQEVLLANGEDPGQDKLELVKLWLERKDVGRWLLVIDNADDAQVFFGPQNNISDNISSSIKPLASYIPECPHVSVLVTTRNKQTGLRLTKQRRPIAVGKMDDVESQQLISTKLDDSTSEDRQRLATRLESLPLALAQAAAFIQENCMTIGEYIKLLDESPAEVLDTEFEAPGRDREIPHAVMQTWKISFEEIKRQNPLAGHLLSLMGLVDRQAIPREFLAHYVELFHPEPRSTRSIRLATALGVLKAYSFVAENKSSSLDMHRLVHLSTQRWLEEKGELRLFYRQALQILSEIFPDCDYDNTEERCQSYLPHIVKFARGRGIWKDSELKPFGASLLYKLAGYSMFHPSHKDFSSAQWCCERALEMRVLLPGDEKSNGTLETMSRLVWIHIRQGNLESAQEMAQKGYEISQRVSGAESQPTLVSMCELGVAYTVQERHDEAEDLRIKILETARKIRGSEMHRATLVSMSNLAAVYLEIGKLEEAEGLQVQVVQLRKETGFGEEHFETISGIDRLSEIYEAQQRYEQALPLALRVFDVKRRELGEDDMKTMSMMTRLADIYAGLNQSRESVDYGLKWIVAATRIWGEDDTRTLERMGLVATQYSRSCQLHTESLELWLQVFRGVTKTPGHHHRITLARAAELVYYQHEHGLDKEALELGLALYEARREALGEDDPETLVIVAAISSMYFKAEQYEDFLEWGLRDIEAKRKDPDEDDADLSGRLLRLAIAQGDLGLLEEAVASAEESVALSKRALGPDAFGTLIGMSILSAVYKAEGVGRDEEALLLAQQMLEAAERTLGPDDEFAIGARECVENWSAEAQSAEEGETPGATTLITCNDQKDAQETLPEKIDDTRVVDSKDSDDVENPRGTPREQSQARRN